MNKILEFGIKRENEERRDGGCSVVFDPETQRYAVYRHPKSKALCLFGGGFDEGEDDRDGCLRELKEESGLIDYLYIEKMDSVTTHYFNRVKEINRVAYTTCLLVILNSKKREETRPEEHEKNFEFLWTTSDEILESWKISNANKDYDHWIYFFNKATKRIKELGHTK